MWTAPFFLLGFDEVAYDSELIQKGTNRERPTLPHLTSFVFLRGKSLESTPDNPDSTEPHTVTHLH